MRLRPLALGLLLPLAAPAAADDVMLVLDASGSMWGQVGGTPKIVIAREAIAGLTEGFAADDRLGLVAYGHRRRGDCADIETLVEPAALDREAFLATVNALNPRGMTPLSAAVQQAAEVLRASERKATVILVSDGEETCSLDPCAVGAELEAGGVDFTAHVIGFDVADPAHQAQLRCLAENTGGRYFNARDAGELKGALGAAVKASTAEKLPPAEASVAAEGELLAATIVPVRFSGPRSEGDYVTFVAPGAGPYAFMGYAYVEVEGDVVEVEVPAEPGAYELRYVSPLREPAVLAAVDVEVRAAEGALQAPERAMAGDQVAIVAVGPVDGSHWIGFAPAGSDAGAFRDYVRPDPGGTTRATLSAPAEPGEYELRYVLRESEAILSSRPITVTAPEVRFLEPPTEAGVAEEITVHFDGPRGKDHWIGIIPAGAADASTYFGWDWIQGKERTTLRTPDEPGDYEIAFVFVGAEGGDRILARSPLAIR